MVYFKAYEVAEKPYLRWNSVASSEAEAEAGGWLEDPLVKPESDIEYLFDVSTMKIVAGALVLRTSEEMSAFADAFDLKEKERAQKLQLASLDSAIFPYDGHKFPMNETARNYYLALKFAPADAEVLDDAGNLYDLTAANIDDFFAAYCTKLKDLTKPQTEE